MQPAHPPLEIVELAQIFRVVDVAEDSLTLEASRRSGKMVAIVQVLQENLGCAKLPHRQSRPRGQV